MISKDKVLQWKNDHTNKHGQWTSLKDFHYWVHLATLSQTERTFEFFHLNGKDLFSLDGQEFADTTARNLMEWLK